MAELHHKSKNRLTFKTELIESLQDDDFYVNEIESLGTFRISKRDFYKEFSNVVNSESYKNGNYNYETFPKKAERFLIKKNLANIKVD